MFINSNSLIKVEPLTDNQEKLFEAYAEGKNIFASGVAGSGKTFILLYQALKEVFDKSSKYEKVILIRSLLPSRDVGFLPGTLDEKADLYQDPYRVIVRTMFSMPNDAEFTQLYDKLIAQGTIEFTTTSFLRGQTFDRCIILCDEFQNMLFQELDTLITRVGQDSKIMFAGDIAQTDLRKNNGDQAGVEKFKEILKTLKEFECIDFDFGDIVRSGLVRSYLIAKTNLEL
jgi:predicted ribonuclease YlaK|tara:strand:+ start:2055 stop:2741 length:687 start_codon:yes stop_codon:yes gene_type:complete